MTRLFGEGNCASFVNSMSGINWDELYQPDGDWYSIFLYKVKELFETSFPLVRLSRKRSHDKPWVTNELKLSIRHNRRLYKQFIWRENINSFIKYKKYNCILKKKN